MNRRLLVAGLGIAIAGVVIARPGFGKPQQLPLEPLAIEVRANPIAAFDPREPTKTRFGALEFRGGLELQSNADVFGGLSAIHLAPDGARLLALSDAGMWLSARLVYRDGRLAGVADARMAAARGPDGKPLAPAGVRDLESLAVLDDACFVGIERVNEIRRFECAGDPLTATGMPIQAPAGIKRLQRNSGLEAMAAVPKGRPLGGALIAISERGEKGTEDSIGFIIGGPKPGQFRIKRSDDFDVTEALVVGDRLLVLERHYSVIRGVAMRLRRFALAEVVPGAQLVGEVLIVADRAHQIDNMEGLSAHTNAAGETILTMISDDNYSVLQRTLVLQFKLVD